MSMINLTARQILFITILLTAAPLGARQPGTDLPLKTVVLFYLNGDNDLGPEVLHCLDRLESVGSNEQLQILALVDGHADHLGPYGGQWRGTRLVEIRRDGEIGRIRSPVLMDFGELNLGAGETLEAFVRYGTRIPADRYIFAIFAHGRGVIDTRVTGSTPAAGHKRLALSRDATSRTQLSLAAFHRAIRGGLGGKRFETMVFFTCLANMVEVAYELRDLTTYLVASPDEIRIVNQPPGRFQIRGILFERMLATLSQRPGVDAVSLGREMIDAYIEQYLTPVEIISADGQARRRSFSASLSMIDCRTLARLTGRLDHLAALLAQRLSRKPSADDWIRAVDQARLDARRYPSFLNLEYYDLVDLLEHLVNETADLQVRHACRRILAHLEGATIVHERHTAEAPSGGLAIYFPHRSVPDNIFRAHQSQYRQTRFSRDTRWDELVELSRGEAGSYGIPKS
jgi:hypothetical protein